MPQAKPGSTKPVLRPEAFQAIACASITTTDQPRRATSRATVRPASPPPITQTSTSISLVTGARSGTHTTVSVYQVDAAAGPFKEFTLSIGRLAAPQYLTSHAKLMGGGNRCQQNVAEISEEKRPCDC